MAYQVPYWDVIQWNYESEQNMSRLSGKKSEVLKCSGSVHSDDSYMLYNISIIEINTYISIPNVIHHVIINMFIV